MEAIRGHATSVATSREPGAKHADWHVATTTFVLGEHKVRFASSKAATIRDGDDVAVCGVVREDVFHALAYRNFTARAEGGDAWSQAWLVMFVLAALSTVSYAQSVAVSVVAALFASYVGFRASQATVARRRLAALVP